MGTVNTGLINNSFAATGSHLVGSPKLEQLLHTLSSAKDINCHFEFYSWLQNEICDYLPHELLLAAWGNFEKGDLSYDAASSLPGVNTSFFRSLPFLELLVPNLYRLARTNGSCWHVLQDFNDVAADGEIWPDSRFLKIARSRMKSMLVYAMRDGRNGSDSLYIFYSQKGRIEIDPLTLDVIMPHIDAALRRLKCLSRAETETGADQQHSKVFNPLSEREREVIVWVGEGKSNREIGAILGISHNTVKNHLKSVFRKIGVTARSQAVQVYMNSNTLETSPKFSYDSQ